MLDHMYMCIYTCIQICIYICIYPTHFFSVGALLEWRVVTCNLALGGVLDMQHMIVSAARATTWWCSSPSRHLHNRNIFVARVYTINEVLIPFWFIWSTRDEHFHTSLYLLSFIYDCPIRGYSEGLLAERIRIPMRVGSDFANYELGSWSSKQWKI